MTVTLPAERGTFTVSGRSTVPVVATAGGTGPWVAHITDRYGTIAATLDGPTIAPIVRRRNAPRISGYTLPKGLTAIAAAAELVTAQLQVYRGNSLRFWGPLYTDEAATGDGKMPYGASGFLSEFATRLVGGAQPWSRNYLQNHRFDDGLDRWTPTGTDIAVDTSTYETGSKSIRFDDAPGSKISQSVLIDIDVDFQAIVDLRVRADTDVTTGRGLEVTVPGVQGGTGFKAVRIDDTTPRVTWTTLRAVLQIEGRVGARTLTVDGYGAADGSTWLDSASVTIYPITSLADDQPPPDPPQEDLGVIVSRLIQATNTGLNIGVDSPPVGVLFPSTWSDWVDKKVPEVLDLLTGREQSIDILEVCTPTSRTLRTRLTTAGRDWLPEELTLSCPGNLFSLKRKRNGTDAVSEVTVIGDGGYRGVARDEGAFGGVLRQKVIKAPPGTPLGDLEGIGRRELRTSVEAVTSYEAVAPMQLLIDHPLEIGDRVLTQADSLSLQVNAVCEVDGIEERPVGDTCSITLKPVPT